MNIKTVITTNGVNVVDFGSAASRFYWIENLGSTTVYVSGNENIVPDGDNVKVLSAGCGTMVENLGGKVYILGAGKFQITNQGDKFPPFRNAPVADGGVMASGNPVQIDGLQGGVPFSEITVSGKNLIPFPYYETTKTVNGITFTDNGDGTIAVDGTASSDAVFYFANKKDIILPGNSFYLSGCPVGGSGSSYDIVFVTFDENNTTISVYNDVGNGKRVTVSENAKTVNIYVRIRSGQTISNLIFRPQLELGNAPTVYEPPITGRELQVNVSGKNLIPTDYMAWSGIHRGVTVTIKDDGRVDLSGTATSEGYIFDILINYPLIGGKKYTFSCSKQYDINTFNLGFTIKDKNGAWKYGLKSYPATIIADEGDYIASWRLWANNGVEYSAENVEIQMEIGDTATEYKTPVGSVTKITPDSNPYVIPNDIRQQDGLNVVSVSEGEISVTGVRKNAAVKKIWDKIDELTTAIIVSNGETIE